MRYLVRCSMPNRYHSYRLPKTAKSVRFGKVEKYIPYVFGVLLCSALSLLFVFCWITPNYFN